MGTIAAPFSFTSPRLPRPVLPITAPGTSTQSPRLGEPPPTSNICPPGYYWDAVVGQCVPLSTTTQCAPGEYFDPVQGDCVPIPIIGPTLGGTFPGTTGTTTTTSTTGGGGVGGEGPIFVNVANAVTVADNSANNALHGVAQAVNNAINQSVGTANQIAQNTEQTIGNQLSSLNNTLAQSIQSAQNGIADVVTGINSDISSTLGGIGQTIGQEIFNSINPVSTALSTIIGIISQQIGGLAGAIGDAVARVIPLIVAAISGSINPVTAVLQTISGAIQTSVGNLAQLGSDISGGFGSLDATLGRVLSGYETFTEAQTGYPDGGSLHHDLSSIAAQIAGLVTATVTGSAPKLSDQIHSVCGQQELTELLNKPWIPPDVGPSSLSDLWTIFAKFAVSILFYGVSILPAARKVTEEVSQRFDQACPITPISTGAAVEAVQRGIISDQQGRDEAAKNDISADRFQVLRDLAIHQLPPSQLVEAEYRNIITAGDYQNALAQQGWTAAQQDILKALAIPQIRPATYNSLNELLQRGIIDGQAFDTVLKGLNFDDGQRQALRDLVFRPQFTSDEIEGLASEDLWGTLGVGGLAQAPESVQIAGSAEGLTPEAVNRRWIARFTPGSLASWIDLYFRGQATLEQLQAVMRRAFIPDAVQPAIIASSRPLIQFRTISRMVFLQLISADQGKAYLLQHGYSDADAELLIRYAINGGKTTQAKKAQAQHEVSLSIAKQEYIDGSISQDQYFQILIAHQYTPQGAQTEIDLVNAHEGMLQRKANAQLVVDEYGAGLINEQVAIAQLSALGLTAAELAKYLHKIRAFRVKNAKLPTEAELLKMLKANIITPDTYKSTLVLAGYSQKWADAFYELGAPTPSGTGSPASPTPATP